jgi:hypothetical protein
VLNIFGVLQFEIALGTAAAFEYGCALLEASLLRMPIPDVLDVTSALEDLAAGLALDPDVVGVERAWVCVVIDVLTGERLAAGFGLTQREAAADAWVASLPVAQLLDAVLGRIPPPLPDGRVWFELARPGCWERPVVAHHQHER